MVFIDCRGQGSPKGTPYIFSSTVLCIVRKDPGLLICGVPFGRKQKPANDRTDAAAHTLFQKHANMVVTINTV